MVLDEELHVIQGSPIWEDRQFTRHELELLTLSSDAKYSVYKYEFEERGKGSRILVMHIKKMDGQKYRRLSALWKIFIPVYICSYIFTLVFFTIRMRRKVQEPLDMLNEGILALAGGNRDTKISYKGPREFEAIFNSFNRMSGLLRESEDSKERLIMEKQKMLADISHDLKTPITVIRGYAKAVADGLTSPVTQKHYLNTIFTKTEDLTEMINAFYDYGKLEHPEFRLVKERQDLAEFIREYLAFKYDEIDLTGFEIEAEIPDGEVWYSFDGIQLRRVFDNIFSNALKHNPRGTTIYLTLQQTDRSIRIEIGDNGVGIPEEIRENLLIPLWWETIPETTDRAPGLGLRSQRRSWSFTAVRSFGKAGESCGEHAVRDPAHEDGGKRKKHDESMKKITVSLIIINGIQLLIGISIWIYIGIVRLTGVDLTLYLAVSLMLLCNVATIVGLYLAMRYTNHDLEDSIHNLERLNAKLRTQRHDYLNHFQVIYGLMELEEYGEAKKYLAPVFKDIMKVSKALKTSQPAVNALLQVKMEAAERARIDFYPEIRSELSALPIEP